MRLGVSSRGTWWISMGPLGWLLFGWLYLIALVLYGVVWVLAWLVLAAVRWLDGRYGAAKA